MGCGGSFNVASRYDVLVRGVGGFGKAVVVRAVAWILLHKSGGWGRGGQNSETFVDIISGSPLGSPETVPIRGRRCSHAIIGIQRDWEIEGGTINSPQRKYCSFIILRQERSLSRYPSLNLQFADCKLPQSKLSSGLSAPLDLLCQDGC